MIFGIRPVIEALNSGKEIEKLFIQKGLKGERTGEFFAAIRGKNIPVQQVPVEKLNRICRKNHQGIVAYISPIHYTDIETLTPGIYEKGKDPLILVLDRITDVRNLGAIARTAECADVDAIVVPLRGSAMINADAVKTSAGALYKIPVCRSANLLQTVKFLKNSGLQIISATEKSNLTHHKADMSKSTAIIMGSEEDGISAELMKISDLLVKIPVLGEIASLNVSVAVGVMVYEAIRQRTENG